MLVTIGHIVYNLLLLIRLLSEKKGDVLVSSWDPFVFMGTLCVVRWGKPRWRTIKEPNRIQQNLCVFFAIGHYMVSELKDWYLKNTTSQVWRATFRL